MKFRVWFSALPLVYLLLWAMVPALLWKSVSTDWIVRVRYEYMGSIEKGFRTYVPPTAPYWSPPRPEANRHFPKGSWLNYFDAGGWGGPVEEPHLVINWPVLVLKGVIATLVAFGLLCLARVSLSHPVSLGR